MTHNKISYNKNTLLSHNNNLCGDTISQIKIFTNYINNIKSHIKINNKDYQSKKYLILYISYRKKLLRYLKRKDYLSYSILLKNLFL